MKTGKALAWSLGVTLISVLLLIVTGGWPTLQQVITVPAEIFGVAFVVLRFFYRPTGGESN